MPDGTPQVEATPVAPAQAAQAPAPPATPTGANPPLDLSQSWESMLADAPPPAPAAAETVQGDVVVPAAQEAAPDQGAAPADAAPAAQESEPEPSEAAAEDGNAVEAAAEPSAADDPILVERLIREKQGLLRLKGEQAREKGELRQEVSALRQQLSDLQAAIAAGPSRQLAPVNKEELVARLLEDPEAVIAEYSLTPAKVDAILAAKAEQWQRQQAEESAAVAPEVAKDLFLVRHGLTGDFDSWLATDDGKAVNDIIERDPVRSRALQGYVQDGDYTGIANVLTKAYEARRIGQGAAKAKHAVNGERARIAAAKPSMAPKGVAAASSPAKPRSLYDMSPEEIMEGAVPYSYD